MNEFDIGEGWSAPVPAPVLRRPDRLRLAAYRFGELGAKAVTVTMLAVELAVTGLHGAGVVRPLAPDNSHMIVFDGQGDHTVDNEVITDITIQA